MKRRVCFVTGTRAEFGLMHSTLRAIKDHPRLQLQIIATGMHLDRRRGATVKEIADGGWKIDRVVAWGKSDSPTQRAIATGKATAALAEAFESLRSDVILIVGDRVEAFAAAAAGHLGDRAVAHVHGGDRALGQADDSLRHAITKLAHVHFPATAQSARRIRAMGEDAWRIHRVGAPGIDGMIETAADHAMLSRWRPALKPYRFALVCLHPTEPVAEKERRRAKLVLRSVLNSAIDRVIVVMPNNDPGAKGIAACWQEIRNDRVEAFNNLSRPIFLGLLRDAAMLIGNSSSGIIEAASFGTPVIDIGPRQAGRECGQNVIHVPFAAAEIERAIKNLWCGGRPKRFGSKNVYASEGSTAAAAIAATLAALKIDAHLIRKLIAY